jgi:hypothetical protein
MSLLTGEKPLHYRNHSVGSDVRNVWLMMENAQSGAQPGKFKQSQTWRARRLPTLLTFKPVHQELNAAYDFRLRLYVDITSDLDTRSAPWRRRDNTHYRLSERHVL